MPWRSVPPCAAPGMSDFTPRHLSPLGAAWRSRVWIGLASLGFLFWSLTAEAHVPAHVQVIAGGAGLGILFWRGPMALSMWRAANRGEVRQARVTGSRETAFSSNGLQLRCLTWRDARGATGESRPARPDRLPQTGRTIVVYVDPSSERGWWEEDLWP